MTSWKQENGNNWIYFNSENGKILGRVMKGMNENSYHAFISSAILGEYIDLEFAKKAIEHYSQLPENSTSIYNTKP